MKTFVAGATGAIGRPLLAQLLARGHDVVALTRSPERAQSLVAEGIEPVLAQRHSGQKLRWKPQICVDSKLGGVNRFTTVADVIDHFQRERNASALQPNESHSTE
jgi:nucleoside-diphosphate-sugar epimerase